MDDGYAALDSLLADEQSISVTFRRHVAGLGFLESSHERDIKNGTRLECPFYLADILAQQEFVTLDLPNAYKARVRNALKANAKSVHLRQLNNYFYGLGIKMAATVDEAALMDTLAQAFKERVAEIMDQCQHLKMGLLDADGSRVESLTTSISSEFLLGMDELERELYRLGQDSAKAMAMYLQR